MQSYSDIHIYEMSQISKTSRNGMIVLIVDIMKKIEKKYSTFIFITTPTHVLTKKILRF